MSTRQSGYDRERNDLYQTPAWVTRAAMKWAVVGGARVWDPCCGELMMVRTLREQAAEVFYSDIEDYGVGLQDDQLFSFLSDEALTSYQAKNSFNIFMNPPYGTQNRMAVAFIKRALEIVMPKGGTVAALVPAKIDFGKGRHEIFRDCEEFKMEIMLCDRITWFSPGMDDVKLDKDGKPKINGPSEDHKWMIWSAASRGAYPFKVYEEMPAVDANELKLAKSAAISEWKRKNAR